MALFFAVATLLHRHLATRDHHPDLLGCSDELRRRRLELCRRPRRAPACGALASMMKTVARSCTDTGIVFCVSPPLLSRGGRARTQGLSPPRAPWASLEVTVRHFALRADDGKHRRLANLEIAGDGFVERPPPPRDHPWTDGSRGTRWASADLVHLEQRLDRARRRVVRAGDVSRAHQPAAREEPRRLPANTPAARRRAPWGLIGSPLPRGSPLSCDRYSSAHCRSRSGPVTK